MSEKEKYSWKRFWCLREGSFYLDNNGFLYPSKYNKDVKTFEGLAEKTCLILLGEPGIGKTIAMEDAISSVTGNYPEDEVLEINLRSYGSEDRLYQAIFNNEIFTRWLKNEKRLHLFLDSLDECLLRVETVATLIIDELGKKDFPIERLSLRVTCRTADLPRVLENDLRRIWTDHKKGEEFGIYELCPLREKDVLIAAQLNRIDASAFLSEVIKKKVGTLAARPLTLDLLFNLYSRDGQLPDQIVDIYEQGCRHLCEESNDSRNDSSRLRNNLSPARLLLVTGRIAAFTVLCNKSAIWKGNETGEHSADDLLIRELVGKNEEIAGTEFTITENEIREALGTGLFTARTTNRMGWAHQIFAEFLAAWYLNHRRLELEEIIKLTTNAGDAEGKPAPQMAEMMAWLASIREDVREHLPQTDPILLMRSDSASFSPEFRSLLVKELLRLFAEEKEPDQAQLRTNYRRLDHPQLAEQLLPYITDKNQGWLVRGAAIDIAEACNLSKLQQVLTDIVLDETENFQIRVNAGYAVWHVADVETRSRLRNLSLNGSPNDDKLQLRGVALLSTWNEILTAEETLYSLKHPPNGFAGAYTIFLGRLTDKLRVEDLPVALRWVREKQGEFANEFYIKRIMDDILLLAWKNLDFPEILMGFAQIAAIRLQDRYSFQEIVDLSRTKWETELDDEADKYQDFLTDRGKKRKALRAIASFFNNKPGRLFQIFESQIFRPDAEDLPWMFEQLAEAESDDVQWFFVRLIGEFYGVFYFEPGIVNLNSVWEVPPDQFSLLFDYRNKSGNVSKFFEPIFEEVVIDSDVAVRMKSANEQRLKQQREREKYSQPRPLLDPLPHVRVENCLNKIDEGELVFWSLSQELSLEDRSELYRSWMDYDITIFPGWIKASSDTQSKIIEAAKKFIKEKDPDNDQWVGTDTYTFAALAGYRALVLLYKTEPEFIENLSAEDWRRWAAIIVLHPANPGDDNDTALTQKLIEKAYQNAPDEIINTISRKISAANESDDDYFSFSSKIKVCWDEKFKAFLREKLNTGKLKLSLWVTILSDLLEMRDQGAELIAASTLQSFFSGDSEVSEEQSLKTASALIRNAPGGKWWQIVWRIIQRDTEFGRKLVQIVCHQTFNTSNLSEREIADFFIWLARQYPFSEDEQMPLGVFGGVSIRFEIGRWRDSVYGSLVQRGTLASLPELERIGRELSEVNRFKWSIWEAKQNIRRHNWTPLTPAELFETLFPTRNGKKESVKILPDTLIMKGGGVKGLAYVGAIRELEKYYSFNWFAGTSAGAIAASLLAVGYTTDELENELRKQNFREFLDAGFLKAVYNLLTKGGLFEARSFTYWLDRLFARKIKSVVALPLKIFPKRLTVYASMRNKRALIFDSTIATTSDTTASFAVRCSMSIPLVFTPQRDRGLRVYDGGMQNNYPVEALLSDSPETKFIGLYLGNYYEGMKKEPSVLADLFHIFTEAVDVDALERYERDTIIIDPRPITTVDFWLSNEEKDFLIKTGKVAALRFLADKNLENGPNLEAVEIGEKELRESLSQINQIRRLRRKKLYKNLTFRGMILLLIGFIISTILLYWLL